MLLRLLQFATTTIATLVTTARITTTTSIVTINTTTIATVVTNATMTATPTPIMATTTTTTAIITISVKEKPEQDRKSGKNRLDSGLLQ